MRCLQQSKHEDKDEMPGGGRFHKVFNNVADDDDDVASEDGDRCGEDGGVDRNDHRASEWGQRTRHVCRVGHRS